jgi:hypothetical protein
MTAGVPGELLETVPLAVGVRDARLIAAAHGDPAEDVVLGGERVLDPADDIRGLPGLH